MTVPDEIDSFRAAARNACKSAEIVDVLHEEVGPIDEAEGISPGVRALVDSLNELQHARAVLAAIIKKIDKQLGPVFAGRRAQVIEGFGIVEKRWRSEKAEYDEDLMAAKLYSYVKENRTVLASSGELVDDAEALFEAIKACYRLEPRVSVLRTYGIDAEKYLLKERTGRWGVSLIPNE